MSHFDNLSDAALEDWLTAQRSTLLADLAGHLDIEAGLQEVLLTSRHDAMLSDVAGDVDIEAGLAAIVHHTGSPAPDHSNTPSLSPHTPQDATASPVIRIIAALPAVQRLALRTHPITHCFDFATASIASQDLVNNLQYINARARARALDRALDRASDLASDDVILDHAFARALANANDRARALANANDRVHGRGFDRDRALANANALTHTLTNALAHAFTRALDDLEQYPVTLINALHRTPAADRARVLVWLRDALDDLVGADLREADLTGVPLTGIRWSIHTQWPYDWITEIKQNSVPVDGADGVFVIRGGTSSRTDTGSIRT